MEVVVCDERMVYRLELEPHRGWTILIAGKLSVLSVLAGAGWVVSGARGAAW